MLDLQTFHYNYGSSNNGSAVRLSTTSGFLKDEIDAVSKQIEKLVATDTLAADDRVFFTPFSNVPRYKFNEYAKDKPKLSRTIMMNKATAIVLNSQNVMAGLKIPNYTQQYRRVQVSDLKDIYTHLEKDVTIAIKSLDSVYFHDAYVSSFKKLEPNFQGKIYIDTVYVAWRDYAIEANKEAVEAINDILAINGTKKIISDDTILGEINQGTVISPEMFDELTSMLGSDDNDVLGLAMEVMANSDYTRSEIKILTLLNRFYDKMYRHKNGSLVNFRSLLEYFSKYDWQGTVVSFSDSLIKNAVPTSEDYEERVDMVRRNVMSYLNDILKGTKFNVNEIAIDIPDIVTTDRSQELVGPTLEIM